MTIILNSGKVTLYVDEISNNKNDWKIIQSEEYKPDRQEYLLNKFKKDFPKQASAVKDFTILSSLASRSRRVSEWLTSASAEYVLEIAPPQYLQNLVDPKDFKQASEVISKVNKYAAEKSAEEVAAAQNYKDQMAAIEKKYSKLNEPLLRDKIVRILTLNSQYLPITLQLMIENFKPADVAGSPDKKTYAREVLTQFKISLIKYFTDKQNKDADLEEFLSEISEK